MKDKVFHLSWSFSPAVTFVLRVYSFAHLIVSNVRGAYSLLKNPPERCRMEIVDVSCPFCDYDFEAKPYRDEQCPKCGERFEWEWSQGPDHIDWYSPVWKRGEEQ